VLSAEFDHPVEEVEATLDGFNVELMDVSSANVIAEDTHVVRQLVAVDCLREL